MSYISELKSAQSTKQKAIEDTLVKHQCQSVGQGYAEIITNYEVVHEVIEELTQIGIVVAGVAWWCHCTEENQEMLYCPHGLGGPENEFGDGWFSEMVGDEHYFFLTDDELKTLELDNDHTSNIQSFNEKISAYLDEFPTHEHFISCFTPSIMLAVPEEWQRA
jgi:hypothetical protein